MAATPVDPELREHRRFLFATTRRLQDGPAEPHVAELRRVADWCEANDVARDVYGDGADLQAFEAKVAAMLGLAAARFMPSGTMAQQIAARIWCDRRGIRRVGMHPSCHMELHEQRGYRRLHGLDVVLVGSFDEPMTAADLEPIVESMSALVVELPTRENGGRLPDWDDLVELSTLAQERGIARHLDGARLWEAAAGYERPLDEVAGLFDSVYVSFYKGIGALPGSMLLGPTDVIQEAAIWQRRHGGNLFNATPSWASAAMRLDDMIAKMPAFRRRAIEVAEVIGSFDGVQIVPPVPQVNMFHVLVRGDRNEILAARDRVAESRNLWLFGGLQRTSVPGVHRFELTVGEATLAVPDDDLHAAMADLVAAL